MEIGSNVAYGVRVEPPEHWHYWDFTDEQHQVGAVHPAREGRYDDGDCFLFVVETWKTPEPGQPEFIGPYQASEEPYLTWDALLVEKAEEMKVSIVGQPAWIFAPSED